MSAQHGANHLHCMLQRLEHGRAYRLVHQRSAWVQETNTSLPSHLASRQLARLTCSVTLWLLFMFTAVFALEPMRCSGPNVSVHVNVLQGKSKPSFPIAKNLGKKSYHFHTKILRHTTKQNLNLHMTHHKTSVTVCGFMVNMRSECKKISVLIVLKYSQMSFWSDYTWCTLHVSICKLWF